MPTLLNLSSSGLLLSTPLSIADEVPGQGLDSGAKFAPLNAPLNFLVINVDEMWSKKFSKELSKEQSFAPESGPSLGAYAVVTSVSGPDPCSGRPSSH